MHSLVRDMMTTEVVTVEPSTPFKEIVARLVGRRVSAVPVVDEDGRLLGVVSRADLLKVFTRPDEAIRREVVDQVILREFMLDPSQFFIRVHDGVVCLQGAVERRSLVPFLLRAVQGVEGVVRVDNRLAYDVDDRGTEPLTTPWLRP
jgi:CBS domain-containing protein